MSLLPKSIHRCRRYPTKFNSGRDIPSNVIVSQIGANNRTAGQVQSEVEFAPAAAYSLGFMLLREPFSFSEDLEAGTVHHQMDRHRPGLPHRLSDAQDLSDAQAVCATRQCGVVMS